MSKSKEMQEMQTLEELVKSLRKDMDKRLEEMKGQMDKAQAKATRKVLERPMLALGVAFVAGMAVGVALSKAND